MRHVYHLAELVAILCLHGSSEYATLYDMERLQKVLPSSYTLSPTARHLLVLGKRYSGLSFTAIVEQAVREWAGRHIPKDFLADPKNRVAPLDS